MAVLNEWDYTNKHVQSGLNEGQFLGSQTCILCAGPPHLAQVGASSAANSFQSGDSVWPIGLIQQWSVQQSLSFIPVAEAGSMRRYTLTGPTQGSFSLSRTLYHGPNIVRSMYATHQASDPNGYQHASLVDPEAANESFILSQRVDSPPGFDNLWIDMGSDVTMQSFGLLMWMKDSNKEDYGAFYLEQCRMAMHSISSGPGSVVIPEQVRGSFDRARPVKVTTAIPLMSRYNDSGVITTSGMLTDGRTRIESPTQTNL